MDYKEKTVESYNKHAKEFSGKFQGLMDLERRGEFQEFIDLVHGKKILDLGCGSGDHSFYFKSRGFDVISADISEEMIKICKEKGLNTVLMDIENIEFEDSSFDGIWAVTSLLHVPQSKIPGVVKNLNRILKDKGILYVCVKEGKNEKMVRDESADTERFFSFWSKEEMKTFFKDFFLLVDGGIVEANGKVYLQYFFKKKS